MPIALVWVLGAAIAITLFILSRAHFQSLERERFQRDAVYFSAVITETLERHIN